MARRVGLWTLLVVLFFVSYALFSPPNGDSDAAAASSRVPVGWILLGVFVTFFPLFLWFSTRWFKGYSEGTVLLEQGRATEALAKFKIARGKTRSLVPVYGIGVAALQLWQLDEAVTNLEVFLKQGKGVLRGAGLRAHAGASLSLACALTGNAERAKAALSELATSNAATAQSRLAEVIVAARAADWPGARDLLATHHVTLDQLGGSMRALADAVRAMVSARLGIPGPPVERARLYLESSPDGLKRAWPELVEFVERDAAGPQLPTVG